MTHIYASLVRDVTPCYEREPSLAMGLQFGFTVRNHTDSRIAVTHRSGFTQAIDSESSRFSRENWYHDCERNSVWLDIHYSASNLDNCRKNPDVTGNAVDEAICYGIANHMKVIPRHGSKVASYRCHVGICLSDLKPNYGDKTYYSEMLGIFIDLDTGSVRQDYLGKEEYDTVTTDILPQHNEGEDAPPQDLNAPKETPPVDYTQPVRLLSPTASTYQHILYVDNSGVSPPVWIFIEGEPVLIRPHINHKVASGLYFFTSGSKRYRFLSAAHITDEELAKRGMAFSRHDLLNQPRMKAFHELKKSNDNIIKQRDQIAEEKKQLAEKSVRQLTEVTDAHQQTLKKAEQRYHDNLTTLQHNNQRTTQTLQKENAALQEKLRSEQYKNQENTIKHLNKVSDLKEELRQQKQKAAEETLQKRYSIGSYSATLTLFGLVVDIIKKLSTIPKLGFLS